MWIKSDLPCISLASVRELCWLVLERIQTSSGPVAVLSSEVRCRYCCSSWKHDYHRVRMQRAIPVESTRTTTGKRAKDTPLQNNVRSYISTRHVKQNIFFHTESPRDSFPMVSRIRNRALLIHVRVVWMCDLQEVYRIVKLKRSHMNEPQRRELSSTAVKEYVCASICHNCARARDVYKKKLRTNGIFILRISTPT